MSSSKAETESDGRVLSIDTGIAGSINANSGGNDPTMTPVNGAYPVMWNTYLNDELKFVECACIGECRSDMRSRWLLRHPRSRITAN
jgi:hypothetical protein